MQNFQKVIFVFAIASLILACGITSSAPTTVPDQQDVATIVAGTIQAITAAAPTQVPQPAGIPVSFQNVSFVIPNGLASGASSQAIPNNPTENNGGPWAIAPAHSEFTLNGYNVQAGNFSEIQIDIFPAQDYASMNNGAELTLKNLKAYLANPVTSFAPNAAPLVPYFNAGPMINAQVKSVQFKNGSGVRMITEYGQAAGPIRNNGTFYHFQGLTSDGKYLIIAILPIAAPFLINGNDANAPLPADGIPFPGYTSLDPKDYESYYQAVTNKMNSTSADTFSPSLNALDALIQSISVH